MFSILTRTVSKPPSLDWEDDGQAAIVTFDAGAFNMDWHGNPNFGVKIAHTLTRQQMLWLWGNIDRQLVQEVMRAEFEGIRSPLLDEVAKAFRDLDGAD